MSWAGLRRFGTGVAFIDGLAIAVAVVLAALGGAFERTAIANILAIIGALMLVAGAVTAGGSWMLGQQFGGTEGLNYINVMNEDMRLQQDLQTEHGRSQRSQRTRRGLTIVLAGVVLLAIAVALG